MKVAVPLVRVLLLRLLNNSSDKKIINGSFEPLIKSSPNKGFDLLLFLSVKTAKKINSVFAKLHCKRNYSNLG